MTGRAAMRGPTDVEQRRRDHEVHPAAFELPGQLAEDLRRHARPGGDGDGVCSALLHGLEDVRQRTDDGSVTDARLVTGRRQADPDQVQSEVRLCGQLGSELLDRLLRAHREHPVLELAPLAAVMQPFALPEAAEEQQHGAYRQRGRDVAARELELEAVGDHRNHGHQPPRGHRDALVLVLADTKEAHLVGARTGENREPDGHQQDAQRAVGQPVDGW